MCEKSSQAGYPKTLFRLLEISLIKDQLDSYTSYTYSYVLYVILHVYTYSCGFFFFGLFTSPYIQVNFVQIELCKRNFYM